MSASLRVTWAQNFANDSSLTSHSRLKVKRANTSWCPSIEPGLVDALGLDDAEPEIPEMVVVGGGDGELDA